MKAQICPVCNKSGQYEGRRCHGCNGWGWVQVPADRQVKWPYRPGPIRAGRPPAHSHLGR